MSEAARNTTPAACMAALICENAVLARHLAAAQARCQAQAPSLPPALPGKRRRRLHELPRHAQDLLLAMSLQPASLRAEIERALERLHGQPVQLHGSEADVLYSCLHDLGTRNALADALHKRLEARHALAVRRLSALRDEAALRQAWQQALRAGDDSVPALLWAVLTHPLGPALEVSALAQARTWIFEQARHALTGRARDSDDQQQRQALQEEVAALRQRLQQQQAAHHEALQQLQRSAATALGEARRGIAQSTAQPTEVPRQRPTPAQCAATPRLSKPPCRPEPEAPAAPPAPAPISATPGLARPVQGQRVLCVGGIRHAVARYRSRIENLGGRFEHHDGGIEDGAQALAGRLERADLVICQAGCINHAAYQRIKQHCQRTGKPCLYLERASLSRFDRALTELRDASASTPPTPPG